VRLRVPSTRDRVCNIWKMVVLELYLARFAFMLEESVCRSPARSNKPPGSVLPMAVERVAAEVVGDLSGPSLVSCGRSYRFG
jgi:hypothetical protein